MQHKLTQEEEILLKEVGGLSMSLGINKATYNENEPVLSHIPLAFYPYLVEYHTYTLLKEIHLIWQNLFVKIAADREFVIELAQKFCKNDPYMEKLLQLYLKKTNPTTGIASTRIDYMGDNDPQLVEFNLMSVGLNGMSDRVQQLQTILNKYNYPQGKYTYPSSKNQQTFCKALVKALDIQNLNNGLILMVVHQKQFNYGDHNAFKIEMVKQGRHVFSITMKSLIENMKFDETTGNAYLNDKHIDAFYWRTGYKMEHFPTKKHWQIRQQIQMSRSIKVPSIDMILINSKRMQSQLAKENVLRRYLTQDQTNKILKVTGEIYDFDNKSQKQIKELIQKTSKSDYVLKPNREGGGNNFFGVKAYEKLKQIYEGKQYLKNYILMKKIQSETRPNYFVVDHIPQFIEKTTAEYSTIGSFVYKGSQLILNKMGGTLVRLKRQQDQEGGVAINKGAICGVCIRNYI